MQWVVGTLLSVTVAWADDWPCYRGANHDGISNESGWNKALPRKPKIAWQRDVGEGYSGFSYVGGRLYTCGQTGSGQMAYCLDAATGEVV